MVGEISGVDEAEYGRLQDAVTRIENAIYFSGGTDSHVTGLMVRFVQNAKQQMGKIALEIQRKVEDSKTTSELQSVISAMAEREKALSASEREEYSGFLAMNFFTKENFGQLDHFYTHTWDRLTEGGKNEMSYRVWEGVRRGEYRFGDLPEPVKEKQASHLECQLKEQKGVGTELQNIPAKDRKEFLEARTRGDLDESHSILDRPSFAPHVATSCGQITEMAKRAEAKAAENPPLKGDTVHSMTSIQFNLADTTLLEDEASSQRPPLAGMALDAAAKKPSSDRSPSH